GAGPVLGGMDAVTRRAVLLDELDPLLAQHVGVDVDNGHAFPLGSGVVAADAKAAKSGAGSALVNPIEPAAKRRRSHPVGLPPPSRARRIERRPGPPGGPAAGGGPLEREPWLSGCPSPFAPPSPP